MIRKTLEKMTLKSLDLIPKKLARHILYLLQSEPDLADRWGYQIRAIHYYEPLPDFRELTPEAINQRRVSPAVNFAVERQLELAARLSDQFAAELVELAKTPEPAGFDFANDWFPDLDASVYYSLIRDLKPKRVMEIGSGYSTRIAAKAFARNRGEGQPGELICIEPYPQPRLMDAKLDIQLVQKRVEQIDLEFFSKLEANDILFIDSSHVAKFGSDVCREFLDILPVLKPGVWIHVHDIFFPYDYPPDWLLERRLGFNEQYLLEAFLADNDSYSVQFINHWLRREHPESITKLLPRGKVDSDYKGFASFWMRKDG